MRKFLRSTNHVHAFRLDLSKLPWYPNTLTFKPDNNGLLYIMLNGLTIMYHLNS